MNQCLELLLYLLPVSELLDCPPHFNVNVRVNCNYKRFQRAYKQVNTYNKLFYVQDSQFLFFNKVFKNIFLIFIFYLYFKTDSMTTEQTPLKYQKIEPYSLIRGDIILHDGELWQCALKNANLFLNLESKQQKEITRQWYLRVSRLELIPHQWKVIEGKVHLKGQELGLGPIHNIELEGMRKFQQMQIVKNEAEKGRKVDYKVIAVETQQKSKYLLVAIEFL